MIKHGPVARRGAIESAGRCGRLGVATHWMRFLTAEPPTPQPLFVRYGFSMSLD